MSQSLYKNFLSVGFKKLNAKADQHIINLYRYNYKKYLPKNKQAKILDIGCGMGQFLQFLAGQGYDDYLGVDISPESVKYCQDKGIEKVRLIDDLVDYLIACPLFDLIVLNDVIEHIPKAEIIPTMNRICQKLKPGGSIIIKTGNMASLAGLRIRYNDFTHEAGFTEYSLSQILKFCKFRGIMISPYLFPKNSLTRIIRFLGQKLVHSWWKLVYFFEFTDPPKIVDELIFAVAKKKT